MKSCNFSFLFWITHFLFKYIHSSNIVIKRCLTFCVGVVAPVVMYVRETIQILNPQEVTNTAIPLDTLLRHESLVNYVL